MQGFANLYVPGLTLSVGVHWPFALYDRFSVPYELVTGPIFDLFLDLALPLLFVHTSDSGRRL